jgi:FtsH-binding integral membrane protein
VAAVHSQHTEVALAETLGGVLVEAFGPVAAQARHRQRADLHLRGRLDLYRVARAPAGLERGEPLARGDHDRIAHDARAIVSNLRRSGRRASANHHAKLGMDVARTSPLQTARGVIRLAAMNYAGQRAYAPTRASASDALWVTYRWMSLGLATTGLVALVVAHSPALLEALVGNRLLFFGLMIGQLGLVVALSSLAQRVTGVTFSTLFLVYTASSIGATFFVTAGAFAGLSVFGTVTRRDLSAVGRFGFFALIGIILASIVNMFLRSSGLDWIISVVGVLLFAGLTAYDTQRLKVLFERGDAHANLPLVGALTLYLDFINMFLFLLRFLGDRRRS